MKEVRPKAESKEVKKKKGSREGTTTIAQSLSPSKALFTYLSGLDIMKKTHAKISAIINDFKNFFILNHIQKVG